MSLSVGEKVKKVFYGLSGILLIAVGIAGLALPIFPTLPFLFLAVICFMKVSKKFKAWIKKNRLYKKYFEKFENGVKEMFLKEAKRIFKKRKPGV